METTLIVLLAYLLTGSLYYLQQRRALLAAAPAGPQDHVPHWLVMVLFWLPITVLSSIRVFYIWSFVAWCLFAFFIWSGIAMLN